MLNPPEPGSQEADVSSTGDLQLTRQRINLNTKDVTLNTFPNTIKSKFINKFDLPTINEQHRGKQYCIIYGVSAYVYSRTAVIKKNVCNSREDKVRKLCSRSVIIKGRKLTVLNLMLKRLTINVIRIQVWYKENHYTSELSFIPNPNATEEDDGLLITIVYDGEQEKSYFLLINASTFSPVNMAYLPHAIPWSAHGTNCCSTSYKRII